MDFAQFKAQYGIRLSPQQEQAVQAVDGPTLLLAVPGSGKTTAVVARLGFLVFGCGIAPEQILTMTYTTAATRDMCARFGAQFGEAAAGRMEFRTINALCNQIIASYARRLGRTRFALLDNQGEKSALIGEIYRRIRNEFATESIVRELETQISYVKNRMLTREELERQEYDGDQFAPLYRAYQQELHAREKMDYDDQLVYARQVLLRYPQILAEYQDRYRYFCVDEAQDTSRIQHEIIRLLAQRGQNLFMVGDEDQSIYGFRAAYPQALLEFERVYPGARVLLQETNFRSTPQIVELADGFIQKNVQRHPKHMRASRAPGRGVAEIAVADRRAQYRYLLSVARDCKRETAVLYKENDSALPLIDLLEREGVPYVSRQTDTAFFSSRITRDVTDFIRLAVDPWDTEIFQRIYYKFSAGISKSAMLAAVAAAQRGEGTPLEVLAQQTEVSAWTRRQCKALQTHLVNLQGETAEKALYRLVHFMGYGDYLASRDMDENKLRILEALSASCASPTQLLERLEQLQQLVRAGSGGGAGKFILSTIHSAKGLEYDRVFLMDVVDGILPKCPEPEDEVERAQLEEDRRVFYVGMTRAKNELSLFTFQQLGVKSAFARAVFPPAKPALASKAKPVRACPKYTVKSHRTGDTSGFRRGVSVEHTQFGRGRISDNTGEVLTVEFATGERRRFLCSAALESGALRVTDAEGESL